MIIANTRPLFGNENLVLLNEKRLCSGTAPFGIKLDHCLVGEPVVLPDQFVGSVVLVGDGSRPLGDRGHVPIVIVGVGVRVIAPILGCLELKLEMVSMSNEFVMRTRPLGPSLQALIALFLRIVLPAIIFKCKTAEIKNGKSSPAIAQEVYIHSCTTIKENIKYAIVTVLMPIATKEKTIIASNE